LENFADDASEYRTDPEYMPPEAPLCDRQEKLSF